MRNRTSIANPIYVSWLGACRGLGLTFAPGKQAQSNYGPDWQRDLPTDIDRLVELGVDVLISLIEDRELETLRIVHLVQTARMAGIDIRRFPIVDGGVPTDPAAVERLVLAACDDLDAGRRVVVHCRGGLGRAGTIAGCILKARGLSSAKALEALKARHADSCPENDDQRRYIADFTVRGRASERVSRNAGAVLGAAIGDALGHPTEFLDMAAIHGRFGPSGVADFELFWTQSGARFAPYTDDTQMAECVLLGLLEGQERAADLDGTMQAIAQRFVQWAKAPQGGHRAPGNACLAGCRALARGADWFAAGGAKAGGCGSVMRAYPFGLIFADDVERAEEWAVAHSKLTHGDPIALAACAAMAVGVVGCLNQHPVTRVLDAMIEAADRYSPRTADMMRRARTEALDGTPSAVTFDRLRAWAAHEAIAAAVFILTRHPEDFETAVLEGANTPGDSDSIATLAGALVGARVGLEGIPPRWLEQVERGTALQDLARRIVPASSCPG
ncbi:MAG: ADP-ribosyl-[dinitrogen reductase] hydrolase [Bradymonadia bacterium]|jgi:ADP-ribosyl-[dinitrogen reductase] hydrolase